MNILITGGAGFIGSTLIRHVLAATDHAVINFDKLTYAGNLESLADVAQGPRYRFIQGDVADGVTVASVLEQHQPDAVIHLAAESHVDRSIDGPAPFIETNVVGTYRLLEACLGYFKKLNPVRRSLFRFLHVSTDEVYGSLPPTGLFTESTPYAPNSPYSASKAGADHLVRAWNNTFGLPVLMTNCSNNYGPFQFPEKLFPLMILNGLEGAPLPVYGKGDNVRDWLYVDDHVRALMLVLERGRVGEQYNIGGLSERRNLDVVRELCATLDELDPGSPHCPRARLIQHVPDRPGHDKRYAIDISKIRGELGWQPKETFASGVRKTVRWYMQNGGWCQRVQSWRYRRERLGLVEGAA